MGRLIEEQAVIECLTNTAKYYEREDADEWTKGIHYGLLHGIDNILDNVPTVEAIPKDQYEARLKADMVAMLTEIQLEIEEKEQYYQDEFLESKNSVHDAAMGGRMFGCGECKEVIQQKINALNDGNIITNIDKFKEVFANLPVSLDAQKRLVIDNNDIPYGFWEQEYKKEEKK